MWIERLTVCGLGSFAREQTLSFDRGCTVVAEAPTQDRPCVRTLVLGALFGSADHLPVIGDSPSIELEFTVNDAAFILKRDLTEGTVSFRRRSGEVLHEGATATDDDALALRTKLKEICSISEEAFPVEAALGGNDAPGEGHGSDDGGDLRAAQTTARERDEVLQNFVRFEHLTLERSRLENSLVELRDERDRTRNHVETQEQAKTRLQSEYAGFLDAPADLQTEIQVWVDSKHRLESVERDLERANQEIRTFGSGKTIQNGGIASILLGALAWLVCQGSGEPVLGAVLFPLFSLIGFGMAWYMGRTAEKTRAVHQQERDRITQELDAAQDVHDHAVAQLSMLSQYETPEALLAAFRGYMEVQDRLERARDITQTYRPLGEVQNDYEQVFSELQVLDTQTRGLVAQARYLSGMDASPQLLMEKITRARKESAQAQARVEYLKANGEEPRSDSTDVLQRVKSSEESNLPLLLLEGFGSWEDQHVEEACSAIMSLVESGGQAIVFTEDPRVVQWAPSVIRLNHDDSGEREAA